MENWETVFRIWCVVGFVCGILVLGYMARYPEKRPFDGPLGSDKVFWYLFIMTFLGPAVVLAGIIRGVVIVWNRK